MTRQEIQALIDAKIKGQGTAVDAGSVLPAILTGILDLIEQGGGGGTADAVQYIPQELTEPQQMQARKNQGLYYEEEVEGESIIHQIPAKYIPSSGIDFAIEGTIGGYPGVRRGGAYMDIYNGLFDFTIRYTLPAPEAGAMRFCDLHHYKVSGDAVISFFVDDYHLQIDATEATPGDTALYMLDFYIYDIIDGERTGKEYHFGFPIFFEILQGE